MSTPKATGDRARRPATPTRLWRAVALGAVTLAALVALLGPLRVVTLSLLLALFPATLLAPVARWLRGAGIPGALVAALLVFATLTGLTAVLAFVLPLMAAELPELARSLAEAIRDIGEVLQGSALGVRLEGLDPLVARAESLLAPDPVAASPPDGAGLGDGAVEALTVATEALTGLVLGVVVLFFYLKDGGRIAAGLRDTLPRRARPHADALGSRVWAVLSGYVRGQLTVALVDAVFIGLGLVLLGVPLALPLAVLVLLGGMLPIVGAVASGAVAVLVALADGGLTLALAVLVLVLVVQQAESNVLQPMILGRLTRLHPLLVILAITGGALVLGVLGAFLAVPVAACVARAVDYAREQQSATPAPVTQ